MQARRARSSSANEGASSWRACRGPRAAARGNDALVNLHGLEQLTALHALQINENDALQSITAVPHGVGLTFMEVYNNPLLPDATLATYVDEAAIDADMWLCNNGDAPALCDCNIFILE